MEEEEEEEEEFLYCPPQGYSEITLQKQNVEVWNPKKKLNPMWKKTDFYTERQRQNWQADNRLSSAYPGSCRHFNLSM